MKMTTEEILDIIKTYCDFDEESTIGCARELLNAIKDDTDKFCNDLENKIEEYADINERCSECGAELTFVADDFCEEYQCSPVGTQLCPNNCEID